MLGRNLVASVSATASTCLKMLRPGSAMGGGANIGSFDGRMEANVAEAGRELSHALNSFAGCFEASTAPSMAAPLAPAPAQQQAQPPRSMISRFLNENGGSAQPLQQTPQPPPPQQHQGYGEELTPIVDAENIPPQPPHAPSHPPARSRIHAGPSNNNNNGQQELMLQPMQLTDDFQNVTTRTPRHGNRDNGSQGLLQPHPPNANENNELRPPSRRRPSRQPLGCRTAEHLNQQASLPVVPPLQPLNNHISLSPQPLPPPPNASPNTPMYASPEPPPPQMQGLGSGPLPPSMPATPSLTPGSEGPSSGGVRQPASLDSVERHHRVEQDEAPPYHPHHNEMLHDMSSRNLIETNPDNPPSAPPRLNRPSKVLSRLSNDLMQASELTSPSGPPPPMRALRLETAVGGGASAARRRGPNEAADLVTELPTPPTPHRSDPHRYSCTVTLPMASLEPSPAASRDIEAEMMAAAPPGAPLDAPEPDDETWDNRPCRPRRLLFSSRPSSAAGLHPLTPTPPPFSSAAVGGSTLHALHTPTPPRAASTFGAAVSGGGSGGGSMSARPSSPLNISDPSPAFVPPSPRMSAGGGDPHDRYSAASLMTTPSCFAVPPPPSHPSATKLLIDELRPKSRCGSRTGSASRLHRPGGGGMTSGLLRPMMAPMESPPPFFDSAALNAAGP